MKNRDQDCSNGQVRFGMIRVRLLNLMNSSVRRFQYMVTITRVIVLIGSLGLTVLASCGGDTSVTVLMPQPPHQPTTALLTLSTAVIGTIPATTTINSYVITITLPEGVTAKTMLNSSATSTGIVVTSEKTVGSLIHGVYTAASGTEPGKISVLIASATGFDAGECCKVSCDISAGYSVTALDFLPPTLDDATGIDASISTVALTQELSLSASIDIQ